MNNSNWKKIQHTMARELIKPVLIAFQNDKGPIRQGFNSIKTPLAFVKEIEKLVSKLSSAR